MTQRQNTILDNDTKIRTILDNDTKLRTMLDNDTKITWILDNDTKIKYNTMTITVTVSTDIFPSRFSQD